jgi:CheY-like chemotaxis protein
MLLCVDDHPFGLKVLKLMLQQQGYAVLTASSGHEALQIFAANPVRAVVLDYAMPEMNGGEVAAEMKRLKPAVKLLMLSAYTDLPEEATNLVDIRMVKGIPPGDFLTGVQQLLSC